MKPEEKTRKVEEGREEVEEQKKKPYISPKLTKLSSLEEVTEGDPAQVS
jgi:hypothetical protein